MTAREPAAARIMLPRCTTKSCPVRYRGGPDRPCPAHQDDGDGDIASAAASLGIDLTPDGRSRDA
jgi:hypothetical protein